MLDTTSRPLNVTFPEEESFEGGVKPAWIGIGHRRGESVPDLRANNVYGPAISVARRKDDFGEGDPGC